MTADELAAPVEAAESTLTTGPVRPVVFWLALPVLCEQLLSFLVTLTDTYLSGRLSVEATSAVGVGAYVGWLASMLFSLVGVGTTALVARSWGAGDRATANRVLNRSLAMASLMGVAFAALVWVGSPIVTALLEMQGQTAAMAVRYLRLDGIGHIFTSLTLVGAAALRGSGNMRTPMLILGCVNLVNITVSAGLVYGFGPLPRIGLDGIIAGTVAARILGGVLTLLVLGRGVGELRLDRRELRIRGETARRILRIGGPAAADGAVMWGGQFLFLMVIAGLGAGDMNEAIFAAHIIGIRIEAITYLPAVAWGAAAATLVGQSLGAGNKERAVQSGHEATLQCSLLAVLITLAFFFGAEGIYRLMHRDPAVWAVGVGPFRLVAFFQVPLVLSIVYISALRGAGDSVSPLWITTVGVLLVRLPLAYLCGVVMNGGLFGAWLGMCADMALRAVLAATRFLRGRWLRTEV